MEYKFYDQRGMRIKSGDRIVYLKDGVDVTGLVIKDESAWEGLTVNEINLSTIINECSDVLIIYKYIPVKTPSNNVSYDIRTTPNH
jgi:hypothetical protein